jgi:hypothetical protein
MKNRVALLIIVLALLLPTVSACNKEGYFSFKSPRFQWDLEEGTFSFSNHSKWKNNSGWFLILNFLSSFKNILPYSCFSFSNSSSDKTTEEGYFTFLCPPQKPVDDLGKTISNNIWLIFFVVFTVIGVISFTWLGLRWQRKRQML